MTATVGRLHDQARPGHRFPSWAPLLGLLVVVIALFPELRGLSLARLSQLSTVVVFACFLAVVRATRIGAWSSGAVYALLLILFHFGWTVGRTFGLPFPPDIEQYSRLWFSGPYVQEAILLATIALLSFTVAYTWVVGRRGETATPFQPRVADRGYADIGLALVVFGITTYLGFLYVRAPQLLSLGASYQEYNATVGGQAVLSTSIAVITCGLVVAAASPPSRSRRAALIVFSFYALVVLALGVRTAVLFPAAAAAVAAARQHRMPDGRRTLALVLLALVVVGVVRETRLAGVSASSLAQASLNPVDSLYEFGGTLRGVSETVSWRRGLGEPPYGGLTYVAPLIRLEERLLGLPRPSADADPRLAGTVVATRVEVFQIGYTPVGEAYLNFGPAGVVGFFALLGALLGRLDTRRRVTVASSAAVGLLFAPLALQVRNASNAVIGTLLLATFVLGATHLGAKAITALRRPPAAGEVTR